MPTCRTALLVVLATPLLLAPTTKALCGDVSVTVTNGQGGFSKGGSPFVPRGVNYDVTGYTNADQPDGYHGTFDPCLGGRTYPACYGDGSQAEANLRYIHGSDSGSVFSYNYVRVFISSHYIDNGFTYNSSGSVFQSGPGVAATGTIPGTWLSNLADFLQRAYNNGERVILTGQYAPANFTYAPLTCTENGQSITPCSTGENDVIFNPNYANALATFYSVLLSNLASSPYSTNWPNAIQAIMAIDIKNEAKVRSDLMPLSDTNLTSLQIDNGTYNMASYGAGNSRQALIDDLTKNFSLTVGNAIRRVDPTHSILIEMSVTSPYETNGASGFNGADGPTSCSPNDVNACVFPLRLAIEIVGKIDFRDLHSYVLNSVNEETAWQSEELRSGNTNPVPLVMGEFGALRQSSNASEQGDVIANEQTAANRLQEHLTASCSYGFTGWGLWTWMPTVPAPADQLWTAIFYNSNGTENNGINGAMAIQAWPNVCS